jgi:hypothetical protein
MNKSIQVLLMLSFAVSACAEMPEANTPDPFSISHQEEAKAPEPKQEEAKDASPPKEHMAHRFLRGLAAGLKAAGDSMQRNTNSSVTCQTINGYTTCSNGVVCNSYCYGNQCNAECK